MNRFEEELKKPISPWPMTWLTGTGYVESSIYAAFEPAVEFGPTGIRANGHLGRTGSNGLKHGRLKFWLSEARGFSRDPIPML
jgi:hypothetical protein